MSLYKFGTETFPQKISNKKSYPACCHHDKRENDDDKEKKYNPNGRESKQISSTAVLQQEETNTSLFTKKNSLRYTTKRQR